MKAAKRFSVKTDANVFKRLGRGNQEYMTKKHQVETAVCKYWLEGRCSRNPCRFLHPDTLSKPDTLKSKSKYAWKNPNSYKSKNSSPIDKSHQIVIKNKENCVRNQIVPNTQQKVLTDEVNVGQSQNLENRTEGRKCENLQSWFCDYRLSIVAQFEGHTKAITGIVFPCETNKLYSASKDKSLRVWNCNSKQCVDGLKFDDECWTLVKEGPWIFAGLRDMIKAWNLETQKEIDIRGSGGLVNAITMFEDILFSGMEDGSILSWKFTSNASFSESETSLKGHTGSVLSLVVGGKKLFSGSTDQTIHVWDLESLKCTHVLKGHQGDVTTVICWELGINICYLVPWTKLSKFGLQLKMATLRKFTNTMSIMVLLRFVGCVMQKKSRFCYVRVKIMVFAYMICHRLWKGVEYFRNGIFKQSK